MYIWLSFICAILVPVLFLVFHYSVSLWPIKDTDTEKNWWAIPISLLLVIAEFACLILMVYFASLSHETGN